MNEDEPKDYQVLRNETRPKPSDQAIAMAAQVWCQPNTSHKEMDAVLAYEFAYVIDKLIADAAIACEKVDD